jgi:hypothetical protein
MVIVRVRSYRPRERSSSSLRSVGRCGERAFQSTANAGKTLLQSYSDGAGNALTGLSGESLLTLAE